MLVTVEKITILTALDVLKQTNPLADVKLYLNNKRNSPKNSLNYWINYKL
jgi:hypothetical protein